MGYFIYIPAVIFAVKLNLFYTLLVFASVCKHIDLILYDI